MMPHEAFTSVAERGIRLERDDECLVWEAHSYLRAATIIKCVATKACYRVRFDDTGAINTVSWYLVFPPGQAANPSPASPQLPF